jgi:hypothetical protein
MSTLLAAVESSALSTWINQSTSVLAYPTILLCHTVGLTLLVGVNLAIDLRMLGFAPQIAAREMLKLLPVMWAGLALSVLSGALLLAAKATTMAVNPAFWIKIACITGAVTICVIFSRSLVVANVQDPHRTSGRASADVRLVAVASVALWLGAITAGRVMAYSGEAAAFGALILSALE